MRAFVPSSIVALCAAASFLHPLSALAEVSAGGVVGRITDERGAMPIVGARVSVLDSRRGAISGSNGTFYLAGLAPGTYKLRISSIGYRTDTVDVIVANRTVELSIRLAPAVREADAVVVTGESLSGQARALGQQRAATNITNVVSSDQIGRFPDANIGDALRRLPGIAMQYDQGEARFGLIRGTASRLNSVTINGERIPSAEAEDRTIQLDLVPADMVQTIEVNKAVLPDMDADAIGGSVNLVTRAVASGQRASATLGSGLNMLTGKPLVIGSIVGAQRLLDDRLGVVVSGSYYDHILGSDNIEAGWSQGDAGVFLEDFEVRRYDIRRIRRSISAGLDFRLDPDNVFYVNGLYNHRDDWENRYAVAYEFSEGDSSATITREHKAGRMDPTDNGSRLEDQRMFNVSIAGEHLFADRVRLTWSTTYAKASEERPHERSMAWQNESARAGVSLADSSLPSITVFDDSDAPTNYTFDGLSEEYGYTDDIDRNGRLDVVVPIVMDGSRSSLKVGGRVRTKRKERRNTYTEYEPTDVNAGFDSMNQQPLTDYSRPDSFLAGPYRIGALVSKEAVGGYDVTNGTLWEASDEPSEYVPANFTATEAITGGYAMWTQHLGEHLMLLGGVRIEHTANDYQGNEWDEDNETIQNIDIATSYTNVLPGLHVRYAVDDDLILRAAWTNTLARPNYYDLVPYRIVNREDGELQEGNTDLKATTSMNLDLMVEKYFESIGIVSAGVFHKSLDNFIFTYRQEEYTDARSGETYEAYNQPRNGAAATLFGFECAVQRQLDFLPSFLSGFGVYANYTYTMSSVDGLGIEGRENESLALTGTANHTVNASLSYDMAGFTARVAANYTSAYIDEYADEAFDDLYYDAQLFVDANASYRILPQLRIFVEANNLTNQPLRYYQGTVDRVAQAEYYNSRISGGVKVDL